MSAAPTHKPIIHFVGSIPLPDAETVFRTLAAATGPHLKRLPDGKTGIRIKEETKWQQPQIDLFHGLPFDRCDHGSPPLRSRFAKSGRMQSGKICGELGLRACKAAQDELRLYTLDEMEQAIRLGSRGRKPAKAVKVDGRGTGQTPEA